MVREYKVFKTHCGLILTDVPIPTSLQVLLPFDALRCELHGSHKFRAVRLLVSNYLAAGSHAIRIVECVRWLCCLRYRPILASKDRGDSVFADFQHREISDAL